MKIPLILFISLFSVSVFAESNTMGSLHNIAGKGHYEYGDYKTAIEEFKKGAELDDANAQYNLGSMYFKGQGTAQDYKAAIHWYTKSAKQGHASAQYNLGYMYFKGQGDTKDYIRAYMWREIAASQGDEKAMKKSEKNQESLIPSQLEKVQLLAHECVASNYKNC